MQKLFLQFAGLAVFFTLILASGCTDDPVTPDNPLNPIISFANEAGFLSADAELQAGETFFVKVNVSKGDNPLQSMTINENGAKLAAARFTIDNGAITSNNPFLITGTSKDGAIFEFSITPSTVVGDISTYSFLVTDEAGETDEISLDITIAAPLTTPLDVTYTAVIVNNASGPAGSNGGLDLDTGVNVPSASAEAELRDMGIDINLPVSQNWLQQIQPRNGATLRLPDVDAIENFSFENVDSREAILGAYETADDVTQTEKLAEGDVFIIERDDDFFLIQVFKITVTTGDNLDKYELNVKGSLKP
ncbi:MAG: hypothetical protein DHS20C18_01110 [Saprospiraceae bacterium]|nr:MAG: hypothetical protein DHS20C18_01110 [Saprospiraceae bacterium]